MAEPWREAFENHRGQGGIWPLDEREKAAVDFVAGWNARDAAIRERKQSAGVMTNHSPEPWSGLAGNIVDVAEIYDANDHPVVTEGCSTSEANAARILGCVNACAGLDPGAIGELIEAGKASRQFFYEHSDNPIVARLRLALEKVRNQNG